MLHKFHRCKPFQEEKKLILCDISIINWCVHFYQLPGKIVHLLCEIKFDKSAIVRWFTLNARREKKMATKQSIIIASVLLLVFFIEQGENFLMHMPILNVLNLTRQMKNIRSSKCFCCCSCCCWIFCALLLPF